MVSVFPEPAPAVTMVGAQCLDSIIALCSSVGFNNFPETCAICSAIQSALFSFLRTIRPSSIGLWLGRELFTRSHSFRGPEADRVNGGDIDRTGHSPSPQRRFPPFLVPHDGALE